MKFVCVLSPQQWLSGGIAFLAAILFEGFANECGAILAPHGARANTPGQNHSSLSPKILASSNDVSCKGARSPETRCRVGGLFVKTQNTAAEQVFTLKQTEVKAKIAGNISRVEVVQKFENPFPESLEAIYVFPLPDEAAVDDMEIKIGDRIIKANIKRRDEALEIYQKAREQGRTAGLLEQERDNIFTQSLANIKPGEKIEVTIRYTESLKFVGGDYEFVFPTVVGPRYISRNTIPPNPPLARGGDSSDADRINPPLLPPGTRSGQDIAISVEIDAGVAIGDVRSTSHQITTERSDNLVRVQLANYDKIPNKDLILRYRVSGENTRATVLSQADQRGGHFATYLIPALNYKSNEIVPKDVVFLMDTSGSQQGEPLAKSKELMRRFIQGLNPKDTFTIIDFANTAQALSTTPLANTAQNRQSAINYIDKLQANGGTELLNGIQAVMKFPAAPTERLRSIVLITDGYIGNEKEVLALVQRSIKPGNRLYSFGVGSSVNRFLLNRLAEVGRGTSQVIRQDEPSAEAAEKFFRQINSPVLTNIQISWEGMGEKPEIYPIAPPDLFTAQPLVLFGKKSDRTNGQLRIRGTQAGGKAYEQILPVNFAQSGGRQRESTSAAAIVTDFGNPAVAQLWGRSRIKDLMNQMFGGETPSLVEAVTNTALSYRLLSEYTAFVAVSEEVRVEPDGARRRVEVPVELPQGVSYNGIVEADEREQTRGGTRSPSSTRSFLPPPPPPAPLPRLAPDSQRSRQQQIAARLQVVSAPGLDAGAIASLNQYLRSVNLPAAVSGETVWDLSVQDGRVVKVANDSQTSTLQATDALESIKAALQSWQPPAGFKGTLRLKLRINADR
ncbi:MAG: after-VIT domain-containing protein [Microcoleus sp. PH2017_10_PVI_O_A]|uniref:VIT domain-containing protein n=1 Tax=unclassified Microcoleus TaxID=2642155 RepID=UPI001DF66242|nr:MULTISPECIES: VIT domain-containing protein [unclassified Microcoleus]TAE78516.1 MAG: VWA domain-containing protein [Oscillatoriales cyanobacterium]MCC3408190.1 after-VIT domain-containing protein [Microcoleus sp. PH2017_10_PVI_O_A]MCC3462880.1 after-VIT domain-containing protein [Microcoleus sp. PH2017_11_PCY_U_A]MCC3480735.1 after-VIT domain-containing protein [Microcoleus sp. PH2017_12_PCY_D_A]MCC3530661.1 after-VIT domain-containing protein [Microcoleus sp. PH2017_21_RUC_O_A]